MNKERWSPYLTANENVAKPKKITRTETYALAKERKNVSEQLQLMKIRIKQLEKEEKRSKLKAFNASELADKIIHRRIEKKQQENLKDLQKQRKEEETQQLKIRNQELKNDLRSSIALQREQILRANKSIAKSIKDSQAQRKSQLSSSPSFKSTSFSPRPSANSSKIESLHYSKLESSHYSKIEEEKEKKNEALQEIQKLEQLEKALIERLKESYDQQKVAEDKVVVLINNPQIVTRQSLEELVSKELVNNINV